MPRPKRSQQAVVPTTALMASAHRYSGKAPRIYAPSSEWQKRCYHHYQVCGEAQFAARYFGHAMSKAVLYVPDKDGNRATTGAAAKTLELLFSGQYGQQEMLESVGVHLTVAGECYLVGRVVDNVDVWEVLAVTEIESGAAGWRMKAADSENWIDLEDEDAVIRVWIPSPVRRWEADSSFRSMLPVLDEVERITRYIMAQTISRLATNGLVLIPDDVTFPPPPAIEGKEVEYANQADAFMAWFGALMMDALKGDGSPSEVVPGALMASADAIDKIKHLTFWTPLDENALNMRKDAIHRFALGMDLPPEMVLGMSSNEGTGGGNSNGVSHWGAWMIEEQAIKLHVEPMLDRLCAALTGYYLRPLIPNSTDIVKADTAALRLRPDRSKEALELWKEGRLKTEIMLVENGFSPEDVPDDAELQFWLTMKVATGSNTPEQVTAALKELGVDLQVPEEVDQGPIREAPSPPSIEDHPTRPRTPAESALVPVFEHIVYRALERGGNKLRSITGAQTTGPSYAAHTHIKANGSTQVCLEDAFPTAPLVLEGFEDSDLMLSVLNGYCAALMETGTAHTREHMVTWCTERGIL